MRTTHLARAGLGLGDLDELGLVLPRRSAAQLAWRPLLRAGSDPQVLPDPVPPTLCAASGSAFVGGQVDGLDRGPHLLSRGELELGDRRGGELGSHGDRPVEGDPDTVAVGFEVVHGGGPGVAGAAIGLTAVQGDGLGTDGDGDIGAGQGVGDGERGAGVEADGAIAGRRWHGGG